MTHVFKRKDTFWWSKILLRKSAEGFRQGLCLNLFLKIQELVGGLLTVDVLTRVISITRFSQQSRASFFLCDSQKLSPAEIAPGILPWRSIVWSCWQ